jgi:hypothetical protein
VDVREGQAKLREIAIQHYQAWDADDRAAMALAEAEALRICEASGHPVFNPHLLLASYWPGPEER